jgi:GntR family transcriptional regulator, transcriptional repressor for pyruvate dehydrogenase complex
MTSTWVPVTRLRSHEQVAAQIQRKILGGELEVGARLPSERELTSVLGVSRTGVREALRTLEAVGVLDIHSGSGRSAGSIIADRSAEALSTVLRLHVALAGIGSGELLEIRLLLERAAAAAAARHRSPADVIWLRETNDRLRASTPGSDAFAQLDTAFHVGIVRVAGNRLTLLLVRALHEITGQAAYGADDDALRRAADRDADEHDAIIAAVGNGQGDRAAHLVEAHLRHQHAFTPDGDIGVAAHEA